MAGRCPLGHRLADHGHEVGIVVPGKPRELAELVLGAELHRRLLRVPQNLCFQSVHRPSIDKGRPTYSNIVDLHFGGVVERGSCVVWLPLFRPHDVFRAVRDRGREVDDVGYRGRESLGWLSAMREGLGLLFELSGMYCRRVVSSIYPSVDSLIWGGGEVAGLLLDGIDGGSLQMTTAKVVARF